MSFNGSGTFVRLRSWVQDAAANVKIRADYHDSEDDGFAVGLSTCLTKDGQTTVTANLPMAGFKHTGVGDATAKTSYASAGQIQAGSINWVAAGGTADALTASYTIAYTALADGMLCYVRAASANATTTPTFAPSGLTAHTITKNGGQALVAGDIYGAGHELILRYKASGTLWELLNPASIVPAAGSVTNTMLAGSIALTKLATQAANTFVANGTAGSAAPTAIALAASQMAGRGSAGNVTAITLGAGLTMTSDSLDVTTAPPAAAAQSDQETATSTTTYVSPGRQQFHPCACKAWVKGTEATTTAITASYNITSVTDNGTGDTTITIATDFSSANFCAVGMAGRPGVGGNYACGGDAQTLNAGTVRINTYSTSNTITDTEFSVAMYGDQA